MGDSSLKNEKMLSLVLSLLVQLIYFCDSIVQYKDVLIVAGNFSLDGNLVNIAQYDIAANEWSENYLINLFLYGESNGVIWDMAVNRSLTNEFHDDVFVVGNFDTVSESSQIQYCSVGKWNGVKFEKVGQGLCSVGESYETVHIDTAVLGNNGDIFVGGSFETRVWDGKKFVYVNHVAMYDCKSDSWLPLPESNGLLGCKDGTKPKVTTLAWDKERGVLFIGGFFDTIGETSVSSGLAMWTASTGLAAFYGAGVRKGDLPGTVYSLAFSYSLQTLVISGDFSQLDGIACQTVGIWVRSEDKFICLYDESHAISAVTSMFLDSEVVYLTGWASDLSNWDRNVHLTPYAIARLNIQNYLASQSLDSNTTTTAASSTNVSPDLLRKSERRKKYSGRRLTQNSATGSKARSHSNNFTTPVSTKPQTTRRHQQLRAVERSQNRMNEERRLDLTGGLNWEWLPGYDGANGPILRMTRGVGLYDGHLFIVGAFNNYPSVVIYTEGQVGQAPTVTAINKQHAIQGLVTAVAQVRMPYEQNDVVIPPTRAPTPASGIVIPTFDYVIFAGCCVLLGSGVALGIMFAYTGADVTSYDRLPAGDGSSLFDGPVPVSAISLETLSGGGVVGGDFRRLFERAMQARHLPAHDSLELVNPKEIKLSKIIGEGSFGRVWIGQWRQDLVAVKEFVFAQAAVFGGSMERDKLIEEIIGEAGIMSCLRHSKILSVYGCSLSMQAIWIVSELCRRGSLRMVLDDINVELTLLQRLSFCMDIADGMMYLHSRSSPIIHRDLKSQNIFVTEQAPNVFVAKIGDWGSARAIALTNAKSMTQGVGTACWLAPEVIRYAHFSKESDVYAYGIVLWEIFTRLEVYMGYSAAQIISKVGHEGLRPVIPPYCPWADVMKDCWAEDPEKRPHFAMILTQLTQLYEQEKAANNASLAALSLSCEVSGWELDLPTGETTYNTQLPSKTATYHGNTTNERVPPLALGNLKSSASLPGPDMQKLVESTSAVSKLWGPVTREGEDGSSNYLYEMAPLRDEDDSGDGDRGLFSSRSAASEIAGGYDTT